jgi:hypothetical protein
MSAVTEEVNEVLDACFENKEVERMVLINLAGQVAGSLLAEGCKRENIGKEAVEIAKSIIKAASK